MKFDAHSQFRRELLEEARHDDGFISEESFLDRVLPELVDAKLIDSEEVNHCLYSSEEYGKINAFTFNESGERLQVFVVSDSSVIDLSIEDLQVTQKSFYEKSFSAALALIKKTQKGHLSDQIQDSSPYGLLQSHLRSSETLAGIDVVEIILISSHLTIEPRGEEPSLKRMTFDDDEYEISYSDGRTQQKKKVIVAKTLVDLNYLFDVRVAKSGEYALEVDFEKYFGQPIEVIQAANEESFESFLCVLPAVGLAKLYRRESSRLLEKNVRSFLQFRGVNKGMKETIRNEPHRFIAFNNGITITATGKVVESTSDKIFLSSLTDFQIVNGGQTTASLYFASKEGLNISEINVMAKINVVRNLTEQELDDLVSDISLYSNSQSKVSRVDLKSRNAELEKIKSLSKSVLPPNGDKWFFEKSRGEYGTLVKLSGGNKKKKDKEYPSNRRFSKEVLGKIYTAWGQTPHLVRRGGEKVFRVFIEEISGNGLDKKPKTIDRDFYEELIARIIIFRSMEKLHGTRANAIGQLRSSVIPYSLAALYKLFSKGKNSPHFFDMEKVWKEQKLSPTLSQGLYDLMVLMNDLIKKYAKSDDFGEYAKKEDLWLEIEKSKELKDWLSSSDAVVLKEAYTKKKKSKSRGLTVDFDTLVKAGHLFGLGKEFYGRISSNETINFSETEKRRISKIVAAFYPRRGSVGSPEEEVIQIVYKSLTREQQVSPENFGFTAVDDSCTVAINKIIDIYNTCLEDDLNLESEFKKHESIARAKSVPYSGVLGKIGKALALQNSPSFADIHLVRHYFAKAT